MKTRLASVFRGLPAILAGRRTLADPLMLSSKAGLACLLALLLGRAAGNPDHVSATFIAVLCIAPTVYMGIERALSQFSGSVIGGVAGTGMLALEVPLSAGIPLAVGMAVLSVFLIRRSDEGYAIAAFTALYIQAIPRGGPLDTVSVRLIAVLIGAGSGFGVNTLISAFSYRRLFLRRYRIARRALLAMIARTPVEGAAPLREAFVILGTLSGELATAKSELKLRRQAKLRARLEAISEGVQRLHYLAHLFMDLVWLLEQSPEAGPAYGRFVRWVAAGGGRSERPRLTGDMENTAARVAAVLYEIERTGDGEGESRNDATA